MAGEFPHFLIAKRFVRTPLSLRYITTNLENYVQSEPSQESTIKHRLKDNLKDLRHVAKIKEMKQWVCTGEIFQIHLLKF